MSDYDLFLLAEKVQELSKRVNHLERLQRQGANEQAWGNACSLFLTLPGLRGFWPMSSIGSAGGARDLTGLIPLTYNGNPTYNIQGNLLSYIRFDGTGDYLSAADAAAFRIIGNEGHIAGALNGLTLGGWFYHIDASNTEGLIGKWTSTGNQKSYLLNKNTSDQMVMNVSTDGSAGVNKVSAAISTATWYFVAGRFDPSTSVDVFVNTTKASETTGVPATIFNSTADLQIGAFNAGTSLANARASLCFLCAAALPDATLNALYYLTKDLFG